MSAPYDPITNLLTRIHPSTRCKTTNPPVSTSQYSFPHSRTYHTDRSFDSCDVHIHQRPSPSPGQVICPHFIRHPEVNTLTLSSFLTEHRQRHVGCHVQACSHQQDGISHSLSLLWAVLQRPASLFSAQPTGQFCLDPVKHTTDLLLRLDLFFLSRRWLPRCQDVRIIARRKRLVVLPDTRRFPQAVSRPPLFAMMTYSTMKIETAEKKLSP